MDLHEISSELKGLSSSDVAERVAKGLTNRADISGSRSVPEILASNIFTYFNLIFAILAALLIFAESYRNLTFLPVVIGNTLIGIVQELRAKYILDKMTLLNAPHTEVLRDGKFKRINSDELVLDDIVRFSSGDQIPADARVLRGGIFVNESLLTGEADEVEKGKNSSLLSGSFVVSGTCLAVLEKVGNSSYISRLSAEAKAMGKGEQSEMIRCINTIVKALGIAIIPIGLILYCQARFINSESMQTSIVSMVAAVVGMIPEGLYLLTTAALTLGTIRLAGRKVLLHDMKSIEALARVDTLCVDKTGTITEYGMYVNDIHPLSDLKREQIEQLLFDYVSASTDTNNTMRALKNYCLGSECRQTRTAMEYFPFSSRHKYGMASFDDGVYVLGAPEFVLREDYRSVSDRIHPFMTRGYRVLLFGKYAGSFGKNGLTEKVEPICFITLTNPVRANAAETFSYFKAQGVDIKVISGDDPETVSEASRQAGIDHYDMYVDVSSIDRDEELERAASKYTVFGRVSPDQKRKLVNFLKKAGRTVAMTGDGVNDILAMKDADCSVAMASGSEAAQQAAQIVLLDSDFINMPEVVLEGRRVVNNMQRSASLFLVKNIFSLLLAFISAITAMTYPMLPAQISYVAMFTIGMPGFLLTLEKNSRRISGHFLKNVLIRALPAALTDVLIVVAFILCGDVFNLSEGETSTAAAMLLSLVGFMILIYTSLPMTKWRISVIILCFGCWLLGRTFLEWWFGLTHMSLHCTLLTIIFAFGAESIFRYLTLLLEHLQKKYLPD